MSSITSTSCWAIVDGLTAKINNQRIKIMANNNKNSGNRSVLINGRPSGLTRPFYSFLSCAYVWRSKCQAVVCWTCVKKKWQLSKRRNKNLSWIIYQLRRLHKSVNKVICRMRNKQGRIFCFPFRSIVVGYSVQWNKTTNAARSMAEYKTENCAVPIENAESFYTQFQCNNNNLVGGIFFVNLSWLLVKFRSRLTHFILIGRAYTLDNV
jgi:hypothetical protein